MAVTLYIGGGRHECSRYKLSDGQVLKFGQRDTERAFGFEIMDEELIEVLLDRLKKLNVIESSPKLIGAIEGLEDALESLSYV